MALIAVLVFVIVVLSLILGFLWKKRVEVNVDTKTTVNVKCEDVS